VTLPVVFGLCSLGSLVVAYLLSRETRRTARAVPRMVVTTGIVRELETVLTSREAGLVRSFTVVQVDFAVDGKPFCCRTLHLFAGNRHVGDVGKKYDFPPGQQVGVYYDPQDPRLNALVIDKPSLSSAYIGVGLALVFAIMAAVAWA
jgi:hypothetical protein